MYELLNAIVEYHGFYWAMTCKIWMEDRIRMDVSFLIIRIDVAMISRKYHCIVLFHTLDARLFHVHQNRWRFAISWCFLLNIMVVLKLNKLAIHCVADVPFTVILIKELSTDFFFRSQELWDLKINHFIAQRIGVLKSFVFIRIKHCESKIKMKILINSQTSTGLQRWSLGNN